MSPAPQLLGQGLPTGDPAKLGFSAERLRRIGTVMQEYVDSGRVAGVVTLVVRHGHIAYFKAFGAADREAGRPMTTDALFRIASQTKAITSVAAMILVEEGKLALNQPVSTYLPSFAHTGVMTATSGATKIDSALRPITIRDLLTHTAGVSYGTDSIVAEQYRARGVGPAAGPWGWYTADKSEPICTTMDRLGGLPFVAQPGQRFVYGYSDDVLGCVVERASGQSLDHFFRSRIFEPLRMKDTQFFLSTERQERLTAVYSALPNGGIERAPNGAAGQGDYLSGPKQSFSGGAGLISTASDYARFLEMLLEGGALDGVRVLSPATVRLMVSDQLGAVYGMPGRGFGFGFEILTDPGLAGQYGDRGRFHWGGAYGTSYWVDPGEDLVLLYLAQLLPDRGLDLADKFAALAYQAIVAPGDRVPARRAHR